MAQDVNHIMQSYTDILTVSEETPAHEYRGVAPIDVDNLYDTISIDAAAITKLEGSDTVLVTEKTNQAGNTVYELNVSPGVTTEYTGIEPVQVDNQNKYISISNLEFDVQYPLYATIDDSTFTLGSRLGQYGSTSAEIDNVLYNENGCIQYKLSGDNNTYNYGYTFSSMPSDADKNYTFNGNGTWTEIPGYYVLPETKSKTVTANSANEYQTINIGTVSSCNMVDGILSLSYYTPAKSAAEVQQGILEFYIDGNRQQTYNFTIPYGTSTLQQLETIQVKTPTYTTLHNFALSFRLYCDILDESNIYADLRVNKMIK